MADPARRLSDFNAFPASAWTPLREAPYVGRTLFLTGATGFVGRWLLGAMARVNAKVSRPILVRALTRSPQEPFAPWLTWVRGDVRDFTDSSACHVIVHAGLPSTATPPGGEAALRETALRGMERVVAHAASSGAARMLVLSSGAVYGAQSLPVGERAMLPELEADDTYARAKREVESIALDARSPGVSVAVARLFTCIGPGYRNHEHLAHVALLDAARARQPLVLRGDGRAVRSYLYGADLALWLLTILAGRGDDVVNVGSDVPMTLDQFARRVARVAAFPQDSVVVGSEPDQRRPHFVPDISHARATYRLAPWTTVDLAINRTLAAEHES